ncbi:unnamed protein product [Peronospora belbahrii]|uniref:Uncharacterized protein n=1 Tax=Peronospora belbahrii TaxID=622444 RepID=A0ABN8CY36_9STRA|nr:unnamed protein product [Peronospora belbahrii]
MAIIEEVPCADKHWKEQRLCQKLDREVALSELETAKPKKATYNKRANVYFLEKRNVIVEIKKNELNNKEKKRHDVGLLLRKL